MITLQNLKLGYDGKTVVDIPHLTIPKGQKYLITGASGSGKTTLLFALAGLSQQLQGSVMINGMDIYKLNEAERDHFRGRHIGIVFQTLYLVKSLSILDNLLLAPFVNNTPQDKAWALHLLAKMGIDNLKDRAVTDISQGQAQRVAIARALLNKPALLLADEPTSSLDDAAAMQVVSLLTDLARETGATLVVSSHDARIKSAFDQTLVLGEKA
jgi:putative ABC transport system ATP-binding protein